MANQRISLKCVCGAEEQFAKRYGMEFMMIGQDPAKALQDFFNAHGDCAGYGKPDHFTLDYECQRDYDYD
jgi:hypothetical protein